MTEAAGDWTTAFIGMGSNLEEPIRQVADARATISSHPMVQEKAMSGLYRSAPMGPSDQPDFVNAVLAVRTKLLALDLLRFLQDIENQQGRVRRGERWGPRTLDLDIILYGADVIETTELTVPHYGLSERAFVLYPLYEIEPDLEIPNHGPLKNLVESCPRNDLTKIG